MNSTHKTVRNGSGRPPVSLGRFGVLHFKTLYICIYTYKHVFIYIYIDLWQTILKARGKLLEKRGNTDVARQTTFVSFKHTEHLNWAVRWRQQWRQREDRGVLNSNGAIYRTGNVPAGGGRQVLLFSNGGDQGRKEAEESNFWFLTPPPTSPEMLWTLFATWDMSDDYLLTGGSIVVLPISNGTWRLFIIIVNNVVCMLLCHIQWNLSESNDHRTDFKCTFREVFGLGS